MWFINGDCSVVFQNETAQTNTTQNNITHTYFCTYTFIRKSSWILSVCKDWCRLRYNILTSLLLEWTIFIRCNSILFPFVASNNLLLHISEWDRRLFFILYFLIKISTEPHRLKKMSVYFSVCRKCFYF